MALFVVAALLFCGNAVFKIDAFQSTNFSPRISCSKSNLISQSFGDACVTHSPQSRCCNDPRPLGRLFVATASTSLKTDTASKDLGDCEGADEKVIISGSQNASDCEKDFFPSPAPIATTVTRGRKRRAIQRIREEHYSKPIDSRFVRTMLLPMRILIWKPMWKIMDIFIDRLDEGESADSDSDHSSSISATPQHVVTITTPDAVSEQKESAITQHSTKPTSNVEIQKETVHTIRSEPAATASEAIKDAIENKDEDVAATIDANPNTPTGDRWAIAAPGVDLSGKWELIVTSEFKKNYDKYLERLGQPKLVRSVALSGPVIGQTMEELIQIDCGESLLIRGKNVRGIWDRTLHASGATKQSQDFEPLISPIKTVDQELVEAEAWWEDQGTVHVSWMRGVTMYGGGSFYSRRYFEEKEHKDDETVYICEGFFEFNDPKKERNELTWRFRRQR